MYLFTIPRLRPSLRHALRRSLALALIGWGAIGMPAMAIEKITLWPTILFLRGQDLCQFQDSYGKSRNESAMQATGQLKELLYTGVASRDALEVLVVIDGLIDKNRPKPPKGRAWTSLWKPHSKRALTRCRTASTPKTRGWSLPTTRR